MRYSIPGSVVVEASYVEPLVVAVRFRGSPITHIRVRVPA
jgi:hypothetical protein